MPLPLPQWFVQGHNATLKKVSYLENFPAYIQNTAKDNYNELLNPFVPNAPFLYPLKTSENPRVF